MSSISVRLNLPHAPPVLSGVATYLSRGTPPGRSKIFSDGENLKDLNPSPVDQIVDSFVSDSSDGSLKLISETSPQSNNPCADENSNSDENGEEKSDKSESSGSVEEVADLGFKTDPAPEEFFEEHVPETEYATCSGSEDGLETSVEIGVAADIFWDTVTSRAQVLSVPASFKTNKQKSFRKF